MNDLIIGAVIVIIVGLAVWYVVSQKKKGAKCIGCEHGKSCPSADKGCSCGSDSNDN